MATIVQKYGGSSLADIHRLKQVAASVAARHRAGDRVVVVVSAMGKTTDGLIEKACQVTAEPPRRELDMLVTAGERIAMALLSMAMAEHGVEAISFTGSQCGIITDTQHQDARILDVRPVRIPPELDKRRVVIVAGYQGVSTDKEVTTLGRGGSDTTAVALAAALGADACEIYSDVDGVYSADPRLCAQACLLAELPYEVMQSMAGAGAKVLNADAVEFARRAGIAIHARKTGDASGRETVVSARASRRTGAVAVVSAPEASLLRGAVDDLGALLDRISGVSGRVLAFAAGEVTQILVDRAAMAGRAQGPIDALARESGFTVVHQSAATVVGSGLLSGSRIASQVPGALAAARLSVLAVFAADSAVTVALPHGTSAAAVERLHAEFVEQSQHCSLPTT